jgi:hypothetical protein
LGLKSINVAESIWELGGTSKAIATLSISSQKPPKLDALNDKVKVELSARVIEAHGLTSIPPCPFPVVCALITLPIGFILDQASIHIECDSKSRFRDVEHTESPETTMADAAIPSMDASEPAPDTNGAPTDQDVHMKEEPFPEVSSESPCN